MMTGRAFSTFSRHAQLIIERAARDNNTSTRDVLGCSRLGHIAAARRAAIRACRARFPKASLNDLGRVFRRDHSTIHRMLIVDSTFAPPSSWRGEADAILAGIASARGVTLTALRGQGQSPLVCAVRREAARTLRVLFPLLSYQSIGEVMHRSESTVRMYVTREGRA